MPTHHGFYQKGLIARPLVVVLLSFPSFHPQLYTVSFEFIFDSSLSFWLRLRRSLFRISSNNIAVFDHTCPLSCR